MEKSTNNKAVRRKIYSVVVNVLNIIH